MELNIKAKLLKVQLELKAPKNQRNNFGNYNYRSCEDILEAVKPLLEKYRLMLVISDNIQAVGTRYYVQAKAQLFDIDTSDCLETTALAREEETKKGMDCSQITGSASSYARKYALNGLFAIDDTKDADAMPKEPAKNYQKQYDNLVTEQTNKQYTPNKMSVESAQDLAKIFDADLQWAINQCNKHNWDYKKARSFNQEQADQLINEYYEYKDSKRTWDNI